MGVGRSGGSSGNVGPSIGGEYGTGPDSRELPRRNLAVGDVGGNASEILVERSSRTTLEAMLAEGHVSTNKSRMTRGFMNNAMAHVYNSLAASASVWL